MPDPIIQRLPETQQALQNKNQQYPNLYAGVDTPVANAIQQLDLQRVSRGQNPLSLRQSQLALLAAQTGQAATPLPDRPGLWGGFVGDLRTIAQSIPHIPAGLAKEVTQLPQTPQIVQDALASGGSPLDTLSKIAQAPGIRMIPGAFIASNLNHPGQFYNHPLYTALDLLPAIEGTSIGRAGTAKLAETIRPVAEPVLKTIGATRPGQFVKSAFGTQARDVAQVEATFSANMREAAYGEGPTHDPLSNLVREAGTLRDKYPSISEDRRIELTKLMSEDADSIRNLSGDELAFVNDSRRITDQIGQYGVSQGLLHDIGGELYDPDSYGRIMRARQRAQVASDYGDVRTSIINETDPTTIADKITDVTKKEYLKSGGKVKLIEGYAHALESQGLDASPLFDKIREYRNTKSSVKYSDEEFSQWWDQHKDTLQPRVEVDIDAFKEQLKKHAKTDPLAARMLDHINKGRWQEAQAVAKQAASRKVYAIPDIEELVKGLEQQKQQARYFNSIKRFDDTYINRVQKVAKLREERTPPARFQPVVERMTQQGLIEKYSTNPDFEQILPLLRERNYGALNRQGLIPEAEVKAMGLEMRRTWKDLKDAGYDPVFVHRVSEQQLGSIRYPRVLERIPRPTQTVKRSWNLTPAIDDISVALTHQGLEWLARRGSEEFIDTILTRFAKTQGELLDEYLPAARLRAKTPEDVLPIANRMMAKEWGKYDPKSVVNWPSPRIKRWSDGDYWVPKTVSDTIQRMHTPPGGRLTAISDPIMRVFRTSILPLAPRWHVYNIIGGGTMLTVGTDPSVWKFFSEAKNMISHGEVPEGIPRGMGTVPRDVIEWDTKGSIQKPLEAMFHYKGGQTLRRLWDEAQSARDKFGNLIEKSYHWNGVVDDMYRTMGYLYGKDKALTKGMTEEAAHSAGIETARKVFQQWDRMTPIERSIMRFIFPFYGWTAHVMRFVMQYPFDHPLRTAIAGSFARNEIDDLGTGLPQRFINMFFLGHPDKNGNVKALNLAGINPFSDVANTFTFSGFLGQTNPLITSAFEAAGVDVGNGGPELFPNMQYDAETGRLKFKGQNPALLLAQNILPQSRILLGFADSSSEFQQLLRDNPEAAGRLLTSQAGLPITIRNINVPQEIAKAELARIDAQDTALNNSLKTGNWSGAQTFPNLRPLLAQLKQMQENGQLQSMTPLSYGQSAIGLAQNALKQMVSPRQLTPLPTGRG